MNEFIVPEVINDFRDFFWPEVYERIVYRRTVIQERKETLWEESKLRTLRSGKPVGIRA